MRRDTTDPDDDLTTAQEAVSEELLLGRTATNAAKTGGVRRSTIPRWQREPLFVAGLNNRREEMRDAADARLHQLQAVAPDAIEVAVDGGNSHGALAVLKGLGLLPGDRPIVGLTDPGRLRRQREVAVSDQAMGEDLGVFR